MRDALETMDFTVEQAYDGSEGLRRYFEIRPDILVVDVMMPKMSGFDMVKAIRNPFILSAFGSPGAPTGPLKWQSISIFGPFCSYRSIKIAG